MKRLESASPIAIGFAFAVASAALFAVRPILVKLVYAEGVDPTTLIAFRMLFSMPIYLVLLMYFLRDPERRAQLSTVLVLKISAIGMCGYYIASLLDLIGLQYVTAQLGRILLYAYPTFVVLIGAALFSERITLRTIISLLLTFLGIAIIFGHDLKQFGDDVILGAVFILTSAVCFSLYLVFGKSLMKEVGSQVFTCIALSAASIGILLHYSLTHSISNPEVNQQALGLILLIAIFCTVIPTFFTAAAVNRIGADRTGITAMVGPGFTSIFAVSILSEDFTVYHALGIIVTVLGVSLIGKRSAASAT